MSSILFKKAKKEQLKARVALCGPTGSGKALAVNEVVQTPNGERLIGELAVGDLVLCPDGTAAAVLGVYPQGVQPIYRVQFSGGAEVRATADHLWVTQTRRERYARSKANGRRIAAPRPGSIRTTAEIAETLTVDNTHNHRLRVVEPWKGECAPLPLDPWVLGVILGDGCTRGAGVTVSLPDLEIIERLRETFPVSSNGITHVLSGAKDVVRSLGIDNTLSINKTIPADYLRADASQRLELLRGLMDTDGHHSVGKPGSEFSSSSETLVRQVQWLVESLGGHATLGAKPEPTYSHNGEERIGHPSWRLYVLMPQDACPFWLSRKAEAWRSSNNDRQRAGVHRFITAVIPDGEAEAVCIEIDHPEREFLTRHWVPTHNTYSALIWAQVLGKRIALIDTENASAAYYADKFEFDTMEWSPPYDPRKLTDVITQVGNSGDYDVLIIDSLSHFWEGEGGTMDIADNAGKRAGGNSFAGWKEATPALRHLVDAMRSAPIHVIGTMRSKMEYVQEKDERTGKVVVRKVGMAPVMRQGVEYEMTVVCDLDQEHTLTVSKSRCDLIADNVARVGRTHEVAETFAKWLDSGVEMAPHAIVDEITQALNGIENPEARRTLKQRFVADIGRPDRLEASQVADARKWVAEHLAAPAPAAEPEPKVVDLRAATPAEDDPTRPF